MKSNSHATATPPHPLSITSLPFDTSATLPLAQFTSKVTPVSDDAESLRKKAEQLLHEVHDVRTLYAVIALLEAAPSCDTKASELLLRDECRAPEIAATANTVTAAVPHCVLDTLERMNEVAVQAEVQRITAAANESILHTPRSAARRPRSGRRHNIVRLSHDSPQSSGPHSAHDEPLPCKQTSAHSDVHNHRDTHDSIHTNHKYGSKPHDDDDDDNNDDYTNSTHVNDKHDEGHVHSGRSASVTVPCANQRAAWWVAATHTQPSPAWTHTSAPDESRSDACHSAFFRSITTTPRVGSRDESRPSASCSTHMTRNKKAPTQGAQSTAKESSWGVLCASARGGWVGHEREEGTDDDEKDANEGSVETRPHTQKTHRLGHPSSSHRWRWSDSRVPATSSWQRCSSASCAPSPAAAVSNYSSAALSASSYTYTTVVMEEVAMYRDTLCQWLWQRQHAVLPARQWEDSSRLLSGAVDVLLIDPMQWSATVASAGASSTTTTAQSKTHLDEKSAEAACRRTVGDVLHMLCEWARKVVVIVTISRTRRKHLPAHRNRRGHHRHDHYNTNTDHSRSGNDDTHHSHHRSRHTTNNHNINSDGCSDNNGNSNSMSEQDDTRSKSYESESSSPACEQHKHTSRSHRIAAAYRAEGFLTLWKPCRAATAARVIAAAETIIAERRRATVRIARMRAMLLTGGVPARGASSHLDRHRVCSDGAMPRANHRAWRRGRLLGRGSNSAVYEAFDTRTGGVMAVKEMRLTDGDVAHMEQLVAEVLAMCRLQHPNIIHYLYCEQQGSPEEEAAAEVCDSAGSSVDTNSTCSHVNHVMSRNDDKEEDGGGGSVFMHNIQPDNTNNGIDNSNNMDDDDNNSNSDSNNDTGNNRALRSRDRRGTSFTATSASVSSVNEMLHTGATHQSDKRDAPLHGPGRSRPGDKNKKAAAEEKEVVVRVFMEYAASGTLQHFLRQSRPPGQLDFAELQRLLRDITEGLAYIHEQHYVHADLKTANVLLTEGGTAKIGDFGTARVVRQDELIYVMRGSPLYMSPECMSAGERIIARDEWDTWDRAHSLHTPQTLQHNLHVNEVDNNGEYSSTKNASTVTAMHTGAPTSAATAKERFNNTLHPHKEHPTYNEEEQNKDEETVRMVGYSFPTDIWSLGCIAMEMITGEAPFSHIAAVHSHGPAGLTRYITSLTNVPDLSPLFQYRPCAVEFVQACLNPDPARRPTAKALLSFGLFAESAHADTASALQALHRAQLLHTLNQFTPFREVGSEERGDDGTSATSSPRPCGVYDDDDEKSMQTGTSTDTQCNLFFESSSSDSSESDSDSDSDRGRGGGRRVHE